MTVHDLPALNASLNAVCTVLLLAGFVCIKTDRKKAHVFFMVSALVVSAVFLTSYVSYHYLKAGVVTEFPTEYATARIIYFLILVPHIILAAVNVPLVILTVVPAVRQRFDRHRKLAKWTFPIWLYVSVTGVLVYMMLYQWYPPVESSKIKGEVSFENTLFQYHAKPEDEVVQASFVMKNNSAEMVEITGLETSCSCLDVRADKMKVPPGGSALIEADFSLEKLAGTAEKFVYVRTKSPDFHEQRLTVRVTIDALFAIEPMMLDWVIGEPAKEKRIKFRVLRDKPVKLVSVSTQSEKATVRLEVIEPGKVYDLVVKPESTEAGLLGMIRIVTDCEIEKHRNQMAYFSVKRAEQAE
ncbi:MAG: DUF420 domain-containing protein [Verrucomicrobiales bacterium]|nr:DUF420 domain-containing protein [Verrucomicrobiales bacterium]